MAQSFIAGGTITRGRAVKQDIAGKVVQATSAGERCIGIALQSAVSGDQVAVAMEGEIVSIADIDGAAASATDLAYQTSADGQLTPLAPVADSGDFSIAYPLFNTSDTAVVANDVQAVVVSIAQVSDPGLAGDVAAAQADATQALADALAIEQTYRRITLAVGAVAANAIAVTVTVTDYDGNPIAAAVRLFASVYGAGGDQGVAAVYTINETGAGSNVHPAGGSGGTLLFDTDAAGAATLTITDVAPIGNHFALLVVNFAPNLGGANAPQCVGASGILDF
jgi:hypothetical protein